jgi:signal transduction histidine kinase
MSFLTLLTALSLSIIAGLLAFPIEYPIITLGISFFYLSLLILNHFNFIYPVRFIVSVMSPIWICTTHVLIGGSFNQGLLIVTVMVITFVSFFNKPRYKYPLMLFAAFLYLAALSFTHYRDPIYGTINLPYDDIFAFFMASAWLSSVIYAFIKDRERLIQTLQSNNTKLQQTTEELERFTYIASHDLKSPLRTINSFIGLIERDIKREKYEALPEKMEFVKSGAKQMNSLVEDILEISVLNNPDKKKKKEIDLNIIADKVCANLKEDIKAKNASLIIGKLPSYNCDETEFSLLFQNMIENGIKYNESPIPKIKISSQTTDNQVIISFEDNGIGIEEEYHEQIFQFFKRLHTTDKYSGTGLGLGLCKKIVNSYDGYIQIFSEMGKGSIFQIVLENEAANN